MDAPTAIPDPGGEDPGPLEGSLEVAGLSYRYADGRPALEGVSLQVPAGRFVGVTGPVGGGKSTLLRALLHMEPVAPGQVRVGGRDVTALPLARLRSTVGAVFQEPYLFSDTLGANMLFGAEEPELPEPDREAEQARDPERADRLHRLARRVALDSDLARFPEGFETLVGERGVTLSGGQKQRVALARALARETPVLLLDDPFSSLDTETERRILSELRDGRTVVLVSHRATTLREADEIVVIEEGRVSARGTHEELVRAGGWYAGFVERQSREGEA